MKTICFRGIMRDIGSKAVFSVREALAHGADALAVARCAWGAKGSVGDSQQSLKRG